MKISKAELQQIIKEEADRFLKIKALKEEKARIQRELNENYSMEEEEETIEEDSSEEQEMPEAPSHEETDANQVTEEVLATSTEEKEEENMNEEEVLATSEEGEEENIEEGIMDWFSKSENKEEAKNKMCDKIKEMVNAHDKMSQPQKDSLLKQCDKIAEALLAKGNSIFKKEPLIKFYPRQNSYAIIAVDAKPDSKWVELLQNLVKGASEDLKSRGLAESIREEVERLDKVKELKNKANSLIENLKKL
tara:strand:+ start:381 stop:1127 length:747 start_codon:yes stop_codon:yes gene_type:complete